MKFMKSTLLLLLLFFFSGDPVRSQTNLANMLDDLMNSVEQRNEAMGSITILKEGRKVYEKAFGYQDIKNGKPIPADTQTKYRIWSITKLYTATMVFQLIEENKLSLDTHLNSFFPEIPNSSLITIGQMLSHRSGIPDFIHFEDSLKRERPNKPLTKSILLEAISKTPSDFSPGQSFMYSNSNYLLLGFIVEALDKNSFAVSLSNRISNKINLTSTYFGKFDIDSLSNKAGTFQPSSRLGKLSWTKTIEEGSFGDLTPAGAGGIVSTTEDMAFFIEALFNGKLLEESSLNKMLSGDGDYLYGIMRTEFDGKEGYGHTGGWISESSLFYYPEDKLTISYATNGFKMSKEELLNYVLKVYHEKPFGISINKGLLVLIILIPASLIFGLVYYRFKFLLSSKYLVQLGVIICGVFWIGVFLSEFLHGEYDTFSSDLSFLDTFYSPTGTFFSSVKLILAFLSVLFFRGLYSGAKKLKVSTVPILPVLFVFLFFIGTSLVSFPSSVNIFFANIIIGSIFGPILSIIFWRKTTIKKVAQYSAIPFLIMSCSLLLLVLGRPLYPQFIGEYFGIIQKGFFAGLTVWIFMVSLTFSKNLILLGDDSETRSQNT